MWHSLWYLKDAPEIGSHYSLEWSQLPLRGESIQVKSKWSHLESDNLNFLFGIQTDLKQTEMAFHVITSVIQCQFLSFSRSLYFEYNNLLL